MLLTITVLITLLALGSATQYQPSHQLTKRDHHLAKRGDGTFSGRATFYDTGLGACGNTNKDTDLIVALNQPQYQANNWCGKKIKITLGKTTVTATIQDECPGCPYGGLDMSPTLFEKFAKKDVGVFYMSWTFDDGSSETPPPPSPSPPPPPPPPPPSPPPSPPKPVTTSMPSPPKPDDQPAPPKNVDPPPPYNDKDNLSDPHKSPQPSTINPKPMNGNTTTNNQKPTPTSTSGQVNFGNSPVNYQYGILRSSQPTNPYAPGGNLDAINQLVISLGSLAAASADNALNKQT